MSGQMSCDHRRKHTMQKKHFVNNFVFIIMGKKSITTFNHNFERWRKKIRKKTDISEQKHLLSQVSQTSFYKSRVINTIGRYEVIKNLIDAHKHWHSPSHTLRHNHKMRICCLEMHFLKCLSSFSHYCMLKKKKKVLKMDK